METKVESDSEFQTFVNQSETVVSEQTLEDTVMTTRTEVFIKENGISVKHHNSESREETIQSVQKILDWVHGPGFKLLESQRDLPADFEQATEIRKNHEQFEFKCMQALATYAKMRDRRAEDNEVTDCLERLECTIQDFLRQLQYRRQVVLSCYTFFRIHHELQLFMTELNTIVTKQDFIRIEETEQYLMELERCLKYAENLFQQLFVECEKIRTIVSVQEILIIISTNVSDMKIRLSKEFERLKIRILETKKFLQLLNYDRDARQSVIWLEELIRVLIESYFKYNVGKTPMETTDLLLQYKTFDSKASETYQYGKELLTNLIEMYRNQGKSTETCTNLLNAADGHWKKLQLLLKEVGERYQVADTFHKNVDNILERIEKLIWIISRDLDSGKSLDQVKKIYGADRNEIVKDYENTKKIGIALMERIKHMILNQKETMNPTVVDEVEDIIKMKLFTLWLKIRELYYYLGQIIEIDEITERWESVRITIDKFYARMSYWFGQWKEGNLPFTLPECEDKLEEHDRAKREIERLWNQVQMDLNYIIKMSNSEDIADLAMKAQEDAVVRKDEWMQRWKTHKEKLDIRHKLLLELRDLETNIENLRGLLNHQKKQDIEQIEKVRQINNEILRLSDNVNPIEKRIEILFKQVVTSVGSDFNMHTKRIDDLWRQFLKELELFQMFNDLILRMLEFIEILYKFIAELKTSLPLCSTREEAEPWFKKIQAYNTKSASFDCDWLVNVAQRLYGDAKKPQPVIAKLKHIAASLKVYESEIMEMVTVESITLVHSKIKQLKFFRDLNDLQVQKGKRCTLEVEYSSQNAAKTTVEWLRNRRPLPTRNIGGKWEQQDQDGFTSIWCDDVEVEDAGNFSCKIQEGGKVIETSCTVKVVSPPLFIQELDTLEVKQDEPVLFQCQVKGHPPPKIEWFKNNLSLSRNVDYDIDNRDGICALKISRVAGKHAGTFMCKATNEAGEATTVARLNVQEYRVCRFIRKLPEDIELCEEERLRFRIEFEGDPQPEVTWHKNNVVLHDDPPRVSIITQKDFSICTIDPVRESDSGIYSVIVKNRAGQEKSSCTASVKKRGKGPQFLNPLMDESVTEGSVLNLNCCVDGTPVPQISWFRNSKPLTRAGRFDMRFINNPSSGDYGLEISESRCEDEGEYRIVAENNEGRVESKCYVSVEPLSDETPTPMAPRFSGNINEELLAHVSDKVTLQCTVHGYPLPTISWYKDGSRIYSDENIIISGFEESHSLVIPFVRQEDEGVYKIVASNQVGTADCTCTLRVAVDDDVDGKRTTLVFHNTVVKSPPEFVKLFRDEFCKVGDGVALECEIEGIPDPTVWWSFNGQPVDEFDRRFRMTSSDNCHSLFIKNVTPEETGRYSITAENSSGVATCSALLIVEELGRTGSYEQWARSSSRATNSRPLTPSSFRPITPLSYFSGKQTEEMQSVEVTPRFDIVSPSLRQQHSPSQLSPVFRVETHSVDYQLSPKSPNLSVPGHSPKHISPAAEDVVTFTRSRQAKSSASHNTDTASRYTKPETNQFEKVNLKSFETVPIKEQKDSAKFVFSDTKNATSTETAPFKHYETSSNTKTELLSSKSSSSVTTTRIQKKSSILTLEPQPYETAETDIRHEISTVRSSGNPEKKDDLDMFLKAAEERVSKKQTPSQSSSVTGTSRSRVNLSEELDDLNDIFSVKKETTTSSSSRNVKTYSSETVVSGDRSLFYKNQFENLLNLDDGPTCGTID